MSTTPFSHVSAAEKAGSKGKAGQAVKKKLGVDQSDFMPSANSFGLIASYSLRYDDLQTTDKKSINHRLSLAGTYSFNRSWSAYSSASVSHTTQEENIIRENDSDNFHSLSNLNFGVVYSFRPKTKGIVRNSNTFNIALPVSERSRVDNHRGSFSLTNFMASSSWKKFGLFNRFTVNFLWNSQRFSFFNNDALNRDWLFSNSFGLSYQAFSFLGFRTSVRADMVRFLDQSWQMTFGNNISAFSNIWGCQVFLSYINSSYAEDERFDVGFYDPYRRVIILGVTYVF